MVSIHILKTGQVAETRDGTKYILYKPNTTAHMLLIGVDGKCEMTLFEYNDDLTHINPDKDILMLYNNWRDMEVIWLSGYRKTR